MADPANPGGTEPPTEIRTFLIADVRGYTLFTQERGDEAAAKLARKFAEIAREGVEGRGGSVIELRGDEALAVFTSPRQAIRAAIDLQQRFVDETLDDPSLPLMVGIGLDAGEAVPVEGGYRGGALNMAARLCGQAGPGEVLATPEVVHLARAVEGVRYADRGELHLKGIAEPVRVTRVIPEERDPVAALGPLVAERVRAAPRVPRRLDRRRKWIAGLVAAAVALAVVVPLLLTRGGSSVDEFPPDSVGLIDLENGSLIGSVDLDATPHSIAVGHGAAWVTHPTQDLVSRIDTKTQTVTDTIQVGHEPTGIAVDDVAVWVANSSDRTLSRIDPHTDMEVDTIAVGNGPTGVAVGFGSVWVVNAVDGTLVRVDPQNDHVTRTVYVGDAPTGVAAGDGSLWITNSAGATVSQVSPDSMTVVQTYNVGNGPAGVAVLPEGVWVANRLDGTVSRINSDTNTVITLPTGKGPNGVTAGGGGVWVANESEGTVSRIGSATGDSHAIDVGNAPSALTAAGDTLWVAVGSAGPSHTGGTLKVVSDRGPETSQEGRPSVDPALLYDYLSWQFLTMTGDGLVGFRKVSGAEGNLLIPDLATSLPRPTDDGTTYTFQVRPGIRYSDGTVVSPQDFRETIERVFALGDPDARSFYRGIVGADRCVKDPSGCDLSQGIQTGANTVTIRLAKPDPDFLYKLALPFAFVLPSNTPRKELKEPPAGTGPYMFESYEPNEGLVLVRNPHFREWSPVAQPDGYPDRIDWRFGVGERESVDQVVAGKADWFYGGDFSFVAGLENVSRNAPELIHRSPLTQTLYMSLTTTKPPFDDIRVRRALNFAVDRDRVVELLGGPDFARPTCQILPPNLPGYQPYCPYTQDPGPDGTWNGPDLAKAQDLIRRAGAVGEKVEVWAFPLPGGTGLKVSKYITDLLNSLGFHATHRTFTNVDRYFDLLYQGKPQIGIAGWGQDFPAPSNFIQLLLSCDGFANSTGLCVPKIDRMIDQALELQAVDPPQANKLWARVERELVDLAPWVSLSNPVGIDVVSERVGNFTRSPQWGLLLDQLWVK